MHRMFELCYEEIISLENLLEAWQEFAKGKRSRPDVQYFERSLMENLFALHTSLATMSYTHAPYTAFTISDPKTRRIHKASVTDRVLHRAIYRRLYPFFDNLFISDSFSCRNGKGTHKAFQQFTIYARKASKNYRKTAWALKGDVKKFFASVDQGILLRIMDRHIVDRRLLWLLEKILRSFSRDGMVGAGLPLGNITSQLFSNIYLNVFDQFIKQGLRVQQYIRYADDFVLLSRDRRYLESLLPKLQDFLENDLRLCLHPDKIELRTMASGVDFLGWVHFPHHRVLRTATKRRILRSIQCDSRKESAASYLGMLSHGNGYELARRVNDALTVN